MATTRKPENLPLRASSFFVGEGVKDKSLLDWTERETDKLLDWVLAEDSNVNLYDISNVLRREPMSVMTHILDGEIPEMLGLAEFPCEFASFGVLQTRTARQFRK
jgi:hypothetical protein